jgi:hypothetical protein
MLCWAYPERIALGRGKGDGTVLMRHGGGARLASGDPPVAPKPWRSPGWKATNMRPACFLPWRFQRPRSRAWRAKPPASPLGPVGMAALVECGASGSADWTAWNWR